jgi:hypothetical protein
MTHYMTRFLAPAAAFMLLSSAAAKAADTFITYDLQWSPRDDSTASATGSITLDTTALALDIGFGPGSGLITDVVSAFSMTVAGAQNSDPDGTFALADFDTFVFEPAVVPVDFNDQLIGQVDEFTFFSSDVDADAPNAIGPLILGLADGESIVLTSATPAPEPVSLAILGSGLAGLTLVRKRRRSI